MVSRMDAALCGGLLVVGQVEVWVGGAAGGSWPASLTLAAGAALLLLRRRHPVAVAAGVLLCQFACAAFAEPDAITFGLLSIVAWYSVGRWTTTRHGLAALAVVLLLALRMVDTGGDGGGAVNLYLSLVLTGFVVPWLVGYVVGTRAPGPAGQGDPPDPDGGSSSATTPGAADGVTDAAPPAGPDALSLLSPRERDVYVLLARGESNAEIAAELFLSIYTVKAHVASILAKLGLRDRVQVAVFARDGAVGGAPPVGQAGVASSGTAPTNGGSSTRPPASAR